MEENGPDYIETLNQHRQSKDAATSLKACDIFFKNARPPDHFPMVAESTVENRMLALCQTYDLSEEDVRLILEKEQEAREKILQHILKGKKNGSS